MNICLTNCRFLGCFPQCLDIDTGLLATQAGIHSVIYYFLDGVKQPQTFTIALIGDTFIIPNAFNEFSEAVFQILQPDGTFYTDGTNDVFKVNITPVFL